MRDLAPDRRSGAIEVGTELSESATIASTLNWLRAGVLGANDGIVSTAGLIFGVAGAAAGHNSVVLAGIAAVVAGAMSMAVGEYVAVSSQRAVEIAELKREQAQIKASPANQLRELRSLLEARGIAPDLAGDVAEQLTKHDPLAAHARVKLGIDPTAVVNPWHAAIASLIAFAIGGLIPLVSLLLAPAGIDIWVVATAVVLALALSGFLSARLGKTPLLGAIGRTITGGLAAMGVTFLIGHLARPLLP